MAADDDALMARVQRRDDTAFAVVVDRHLGPVHRYLVRLTGSTAEAEELCQETFLRVWEHAGRYRPGTVQLTTWLHRIAPNLAVDSLRRRRPLDDGSAAWGDEARGPEALALAAEMGDALHRALAALPATQRAALLLCQAQGFSNREAADILGVGVRGLESLVARARRTLRSAVLDGEPSRPPSTMRREQ